MRDDPLLARLATANPVPEPAAAPGAPTLPARQPMAWTPRRRSLIALAAGAVVAVPAVAFAGDIGSLLGLSNAGTTVASDSLPARQDAVLSEGMDSLSWPAQSQLLGTRDGISVYVSKKDDGSLCVELGPASVGGPGTMIGCLPPDLAARSVIFGVPMTDGTDRPGTPRIVHEFAGVAVDGIAHVDLIAADGTTLASAPVVDNVYAADPPTEPVAAVVAYDAAGNAVYRTTLGRSPSQG
jgi:hypothetical protein